MKNILIKKNSTILETLVKLQSSQSKCLIVINDQNVLLGTINDGDVRRAILKSAKLNFKILKYFNKKCYFVRKDKLSQIDIKEKFKKLDINLIPVVDKNKKVIDFIPSTFNKKKILIKKNKKFETVIMAGGLGTRLKPYTNILPKPLLPYKNKTIIENVINNFSNYGIKKFIISINYKNILVKSFFKELNPNYKVSFLEEKKPLGTAGILYKLSKNKKKFIVSNCDVIIDVDYNDLISYHEKSKFDITLVVSVQNERIPYGVCKTINNKLQSITEKPEKNYLANSGLYVVNGKVFQLIKKNENLSFVDLIKRALNKNLKIGIYPIPSNAWVDLGQSIDFTREN